MNQLKGPTRVDTGTFSGLAQTIRNVVELQSRTSDQWVSRSLESIAGDCLEALEVALDMMGGLCDSAYTARAELMREVDILKATLEAERKQPNERAERSRAALVSLGYCGECCNPMPKCDCAENSGETLA